MEDFWERRRTRDPGARSESSSLQVYTIPLSSCSPTSAVARGRGTMTPFAARSPPRLPLVNRSLPWPAALSSVQLVAHIGGYINRSIALEARFSPLALFLWSVSLVGLLRWLVDNIPIRVFRNYHDTQINFPESQAMRVFGSLWNAEQWATNGGSVKTDWRLVPFKAYLQGFQTRACFWEGPQSIWKCANKNNPVNWWANPAFFKLNSKQLGQMKWVQKNFFIYDYCKDFQRFKWNMPKECSLAQF